MSPLSFHPAVAAWFTQHFPAPTEAQARAWPLIQSGQNVLIAAPTGSGKTLAAFLAAIDALVRQGVEGELPDETIVVYISPLKALSNDVQRNLAAPLAGIRSELAAMGLPDVPLRTLVRTGDTSQSERVGMWKRPPHIVVTTPESLYILLGSESGRKMLKTTRTVIVDEIHAVAANKRGSHLALSLERLASLTPVPPVRIGLSATQRPIEDVARFLVGNQGGVERDCSIVDTGHVRERDIAIEVPSSPLQAVMSHDVWDEVYGRLAELALTHRTTLVFVNTRRMAERVARHLTERLGADQVMSHHGSMAKELRHRAEQRLKHGELKVLAATASLELGIDIGDVDLVCQLGSTRSIATFLQRAGRASHQVGGVPKARLFPLSRDDLVECAALVASVARGELDRLRIPTQPLDVLAQQMVAEVAARDLTESELFEIARRAHSYANLSRESFDEIVRTLADGYSTSRGHRAAYLHRDAVNAVLRGRRGARLTALTSGGAIPDNADYDVVLEPSNQIVGTVNEDFAVESLGGDVFQLGNTSYKILRIEAGRVRVEDAQGQAPTIPFWLGEAPARSDELSQSVSRLRDEIAARPEGETLDVLAHHGVASGAATQLVEYLGGAKAVLGALPTHQRLVLERFFDESGGMQLVIHSPYGSRINRAWGLALRKRFCVKFNFELQAAATEDAIVLSLSTSHSFALEDVARYLNSRTVRDVLVQALLDSPMFTARWRWIASISLALPRFVSGRKVPAPLQRMRAEDLMASVFPDQIACAENLVGPREIPDHPLVRQAIDDCLHDAMDIDGFERVLRDIETGAIEVIARDLPAPSPLALEVLTARPYAYLDDAPLEERRTQAVMARRWIDQASAADLGRLDAAAIARVTREAWPAPANVEEMHDSLLMLGCVTANEVDGRSDWDAWLHELAAQRRATRATIVDHQLWVAAERLPWLRAVHSQVTLQPVIEPPAEFAKVVVSREEALRELARGRLEALGPVRVETIADAIKVTAIEVESALAQLAQEGVAMRGSFTPGSDSNEWCDRTLLARIHRLTVQQLRQEIEPVATQEFMRFLLRWQHVAEGERRAGPDALDVVIAQLQGFEAAAAAWESEILPARLEDYDFTWLDDLCLSGRAIWTRLGLSASGNSTAGSGPIRTTPVTLLPRKAAALWSRAAPALRVDDSTLSPRAAAVIAHLRTHGASFFDEIVEHTHMLRSEVEDALAECVVAGLATSDSFAGLRALLTPSGKRKPFGGRKRGRSMLGIEDAGRWSLIRRAVPEAPAAQSYREADPEVLEHIVHVLLRRYGVVFWRLLQREASWLPPWRELLRVLRRMEARGDIRGGRFVAGISGEQFALPEAVQLLRETRRSSHTNAFVAVSAADPLNLVGIVLPGAKVPALASNRVLYRDGAPVAALVGGDVHWLEALDPATMRAAEALLIRRQMGAPLLAYLR
ncbi:MAG TPA: DEAD/DEAH box helicase [Casimicrobiaceae bacterium]|nr:DEAD/DEAH box helicase [Casimicrobiaceae bacterium]